MGNSAGWTETEVRAAVGEYFALLRAEQGGRQVNKAALYRRLSERFPRRPPKAFELKFQNISAVLYEQRLPYASGLKPRFNYQRLLRLMVLDYIDRTPIPAIEPHEILFAKLRELRTRGPINVAGKGSGRFGLAIEAALGIPQNSAKAADFMGIELKAKSDNTLQTLFSRTPSRFVEDFDKTAMFQRHSYHDKTGRRALYTSFNNSPDTLGFRLVPDALVIRVTRNGTTVLEYDTERLEEALLSKHSQTAFITVGRCVNAGTEACTLEQVTYCKWPSIIRFVRLVSSGDVSLDFTMSQDAAHRVKDHGFLWRIKSSALPKLYLSSENQKV
jgi:hypothetical protein